MFTSYERRKLFRRLGGSQGAQALPIPTFVSAGASAEGTGAIGAIPIPAGIQADDILLLFFATPNQAVTITAPAGWVEVADSPQGTGVAGTSGATRLTVFWKRTSGSEVSPSGPDPGDNWVAAILAFRGCAASGDPWDVTAGDIEAAADTSVDIPGDTTTVANCLIVAASSTTIGVLGVPQFSNWANADLANVTERIDAIGTAGNDSGFGVATGEKAAAGAYGVTTATLATASAQGRMSIALRPA